MKVKFDLECTPEEARQFLGLPDVVPMQEALMKQLQAKLAENIRTLDPEALARTWIPLTMQSWGDMQKMFWSQMNTGQRSYTSPRTSPRAPEPDDVSQDDEDGVEPPPTRRPFASAKRPAAAKSARRR